jgi:hypothetical protein
MTASQLKRILKDGLITKRAAAHELGVSERQVHRYCSGAAVIPKKIESLVKFLWKPQ